jgi:HPt (histidine-containing phosphotransfer) domain-containing protein
VSRVATLIADPAGAADHVIDRRHLAQITFGDRGLERELLELFDRQAAILIARMRASDAGAVATLAHTLKGSASGIGACNVARAAAVAERAATGPATERACALDRLAVAIEEARALIAELLRTH